MGEALPCLCFWWARALFSWQLPIYPPCGCEHGLPVAQQVPGALWLPVALRHGPEQHLEWAGDHLVLEREGDGVASGSIEIWPKNWDIRAVSPINVGRKKKIEKKILKTIEKLCFQVNLSRNWESVKGCRILDGLYLGWCKICCSETRCKQHRHHRAASVLPPLCFCRVR